MTVLPQKPVCSNCSLSPCAQEAEGWLSSHAAFLPRTGQCRRVRALRQSSGVSWAGLRPPFPSLPGLTLYQQGFSGKGIRWTCVPSVCPPARRLGYSGTGWSGQGAPTPLEGHRPKHRARVTSRFVHLPSRHGCAGMRAAAPQGGSACDPTP